MKLDRTQSIPAQYLFTKWAARNGALAFAFYASVKLCLVSAAEVATQRDNISGAEINPELQERWDSRYRSEQRPRWDTGLPSSELKRLVEQKVLRPCRVVELGCGTGVNAVYLASQGFEVTAIDIAPTALRAAEERARKAGVQVRWIEADVLHPPKLE